DRANRGFRLLRRLAHRSTVVVDHRGGGPWLRPCRDVAIHLYWRVSRMGVAQEVPEELPPLRAHTALAHARYRKEEEVPGFPELARVAQSLREGPRMGSVKDREPIHHLWVVHRCGPGGGSAPVMAHQQRRLGAALADEALDIVGQLVGCVGCDAQRLR